MPKELTVVLPNRPGQLAALADALGKARVNIKSMSASTARGKGTIRVIPSDASAAKRALKKAKIRVSKEREVLEVRLADKPGALARVANRLAKKKVNIDSLYLLGTSGKRATVAVGVKNVRAAKKALGR